MEFRVLGPVELRAGKQPVALGGPRQRHVLAVLLMSPRRVVPIETLVDQVWGESPPAEARSTLYSYVARLRRLVRQFDGVDLVRQSGGYLLDVDPDAVDWHRFRRLCGESRSATGRDRADMVRGALDLWRGTPLSDLSGAWVSDVRETMQQQRLRTAAEWAGLELRLGRTADVVDRLRGLIEQFPLAETLIAEYMRALAQQGRRAEALMCYARTRERISEELGVDPSAQLRQAHEDILVSDTAAPPERTPEWRGPQCHLDRLIARDDEHRTLVELVGAHRLVTVTGPAGCGKTALAHYTAARLQDRYRDGVAMLTLAAVSSVDQAVSALGALFGVTRNHGVEDVERVLRDHQALVVMDNCEHLDGELADLVERLLAGCPDLTVLATSRHTLEISGESLLALSPLRLPVDVEPHAPAMVFLLERATQAMPGFVITGDDLPHAAEICRRLDGLPLALELAAVRLRTLAMAQLAEVLGTGLELLARNASRAGQRHRTLVGAIDWSYQLLSATEQRLLARLSVFAGGFLVTDAAVVCGFAPLTEHEVALTIAALVDKSLAQPYERDGARRLRLLESVKMFATARLAEFGETDTVAGRLLDRWVEHARRIDATEPYEQQLSALGLLVPEVPNIRRCLDYGFTHGRQSDAAEIVARTFEFWLRHRAFLTEGQTWLDQAMTAGQGQEVRLLLRFHKAICSRLAGDSLGDLEIMSPILPGLAAHRPREYLEAQANLLTVLRSLVNPEVLSTVDEWVAAACERDDEDVLTVLTSAGAVLADWGRPDDAARMCTEYVRRVWTQFGRGPSAAQLVIQLEVALWRGDAPVASALTEDLTARLGDISHPAEQESPRAAIARSHLVAGRPDVARRFLTDSVVWLRAAYPYWGSRTTEINVLLAEAARRTGDTRTALATLSDVFDGDIPYEHGIDATLVAALLAADLGHHDRSADLAARWDRLRRQVGLPAPLGFTAAVRDLGLDPAPPAGPAPGFSWSAEPFADLVASAARWCGSARSLAAVGRGAAASDN